MGIILRKECAMNEIDEEIEQTAEEPADNEEETSAEEQDNGSKSEEEPKRTFSDALGWVNSIVYAVAAMLVLNLFFFRSITVSGPSMLDTLQDNDKVIATNFFYTPDYEDIVIIQASRVLNKGSGIYGEPIIKRVIALAGDTIRIDYENGEVYRNGELLREDYIKDLTHYRQAGWLEGNKDYVVPENCVFVMGDNRPVSNDSRNLPDLGFVDTDLIMGKAFVRISPINSFKWL